MTDTEQKFDDGGPAFPRQTEWEPSRNEAEPDNTYIAGNEGMSLRDYFAGHAMEAILAKGPLRSNKPCDLPNVIEGTEEQFSTTMRAIVVAAGRYADAMLAERKRRIG